MTAITDTTAATDLQALVQPHRVHRSIYTDADVFNDEMSKVFGGAWVYLAHESQVPNPNDFLASHMGLRPLIITRDEDGGLHALFNRCAHRASSVCQSRVRLGPALPMLLPRLDLLQPRRLGQCALR